jgi:hypothetical protein
MDRWTAVRERFLFACGDRVPVRIEWIEQYRARYSLPLPQGYLEMLDAFGPGCLVGFMHLLPPQQLVTYGDKMRSFDVDPAGPDFRPAWDRKMVFAITDNGDDVAWDVEGGDAIEIQRDRGMELEPMADGFLELATSCADGKMRSLLRPWFIPSNPQRMIRLRFRCDHQPPPDAVAEWTNGIVTALRAVMLDAADHREHRWVAREVYLPGSDAVVHVQAVWGGPGGCWWDYLALGAPSASENALRALAVSGEALGWPSAMGPLFDAAERELVVPRS